VKINLNGLYDILDSADARRQFEHSIILRFREKLEWLNIRVDRHNENREELQKLQNQLFELGDNTAALEIDDHISECDGFSDYNKTEWTAMIAIMQTLVGEDPGDNRPFDTEAITGVLVEYRRWAKVAEWQEVADGISSDGESQNAAMSADDALNKAIEWAIREIGRPGSEVHWKVFFAKVWTRCGVEPGAKGYSERTIRRLAASRSN
jgi:hypothetical protein